MKGQQNIPLSIALQKEHKRRDIFTKIHLATVKGLRNPYSEFPKAWLVEKGLTLERTGAGFNSGQLHYDGDQIYKDALVEIGFRKYSRKNSNGVDGYKTFGNYGLLFPLKNIKGNIVNFYAIRIKIKPEEHSMLNEEGIYPAFPHEMTTRLFITTQILDAATLLQSDAIQNRDSLILIPGGKILKQHEDAIKCLSAIQSIVWIDANNKNQSIMKDSTNELRSLIQRVPLRRVVVPETENLNQIFLRK